MKKMGMSETAQFMTNFEFRKSLHSLMHEVGELANSTDVEAKRSAIRKYAELKSKQSDAFRQLAEATERASWFSRRYIKKYQLQLAESLLILDVIMSELEQKEQPR